MVVLVVLKCMSFVVFAFSSIHSADVWEQANVIASWCFRGPPLPPSAVLNHVEDIFCNHHFDDWLFLSSHFLQVSHALHVRVCMDSVHFFRKDALFSDC